MPFYKKPVYHNGKLINNIYDVLNSRPTNMDKVSSSKNNCKHLGEHTRSTKISLCGSCSSWQPVYYCNLHSCECTFSKSKVQSQSERICLGCEDGPWH